MPVMKPYSTKLFRKPAPEFEEMFIMHGWSKINELYGKRCANRWYIMLGAERLKAARARYLGRGSALAVNIQVEASDGV